MPDTSHLVAALVGAWLAAPVCLVVGAWLAGGKAEDRIREAANDAYGLGLIDGERGIDRRASRASNADERLLAEIAAEFAENNRHL